MISIRHVLLDEIDLLTSLAKETFYDTFAEGNSKEHLDMYLKTNVTAEKFRKELQNEHSFFYFIFFQNKIAGYLKLNIEDCQTEDVGNDTLEIERIYIKRDFQKQKLGSKLLKYALEKAKEFKKKTIWLGVWENNFKAISFYEIFGFKKFDTHTFFFGNEEQTDILMRLKL